MTVTFWKRFYIVGAAIDIVLMLLNLVRQLT
jgi:hypothetical protein